MSTRGNQGTRPFIVPAASNFTSAASSGGGPIRAVPEEFLDARAWPLAFWTSAGANALNVTFEFVGGPQDGKLVSGQLGEGCDTERHYLFTSYGTVGFLFKVASDFAVETLAQEGLKSNKRHSFQKHFYVVADRQGADEEVYVRVEYVPNAINAGQARS